MQNALSLLRTQSREFFFKSGLAKPWVPKKGSVGRREGNKQIPNDRGDERSVYCTSNFFLRGLGAKCFFLLIAPPKA